ncbi:hypothetical protein ACIG3E_23500 [Streptomyces sp. NPDC053474]|uniref:hypothetical protein n=1 Tax=Streptomyces sp. NPDC053474 TaxID=3365704 RepID=UPI0037D94DBD
MASGIEGVFRALNTEWTLVCSESTNGMRVAGWLEDAAVFASGEAPVDLPALLSELESRDRAQGRAHSDRWLWALLERAADRGADAQLSARVVVQAMTPGAVRLTQRLRAGQDFDEVAQVVLASLYQVVRAYPLHRRQKVAANLQMETLHLASREIAADLGAGGTARVEDLAHLAADQDVTEDVWQAVVAAQAVAGELVERAEDAVGARGELIELLVWGVEAGVLDGSRAQVIARDAHADGRGAAARAGVSAVTWRKRRQRTTHQLRALADQWVCAA